MLSLEEIKELLKKKEYQLVIEHADDIEKEGNDESLQLLALVYFQHKQFENSVNIYAKLTEKNNHQSDWFNLCTSAVALKNFELGEQAFQHAMELSNTPNKKGLMPPQALTFYYMCALADAENYSAAINKSVRMKNYYRSIFTTEDRFAISRGLPAFSQFLKISNQILVKAGNKAEHLKWLEDFKLGIDEDGKKAITKFLKDQLASE